MIPVAKNNEKKAVCRSVDVFEKKEQVGQGTYGEVYLAKEKETGKQVALKKVRMENEKEGFPITAIREIKILRALNHPNIINLIEVVTSKSSKQGGGGGKGTSIYMVFEAMSHDLTGLMESEYSKHFSQGQVKCYMQQLFEALNYCHRNAILHRDINSRFFYSNSTFKPSNILLNPRGEVKLADFGLSRPYDGRKNYTNRVVTLWYRAPELLLGTQRYGPGIDMWSAGCILAELLLNHPLLPGPTEPDQLRLIWRLCGTPDKNNWVTASDLPLYTTLKPAESLPRRVQQKLGSLTTERKAFFNKEALELLDRLLTLDPEKRCTAAEVLDSDYFWTDPMPTPKEKLPHYPACFEWTKKKLQRPPKDAAPPQKKHKN